jgi:uncharacterized protein (TIGR03790 family)
MKAFFTALSLCLVCGICVAAEEVHFDLSAETIVVFNSDFPHSRDLAEYYAQKRGIPPERLIGLKCPTEDSISREQYETFVRQPLHETLVRRKLWASEKQPAAADSATAKTEPSSVAVNSGVRVVVLMRGIPFQIRRETQNPQRSKEDEASVDSELTLLGTPQQATAGAARNPYFDQPVRFQMLQGSPGLLLVGRLDGPNADTVKRMIDDAITAEQEGLRGRAVIDLALKAGAYEEGENWLRQSAILFRQNGFPVYVDRDEPVIPGHWPLPDTIFYFGWYSTNASGALSNTSFRFKPGAIACHLHSFSASALRAPDRQWVGPLLTMGAAAALGNVYEPYLSLTVHFDVFNKRLLEGYTLAEAAWNATPVLSWMNVVVGDPLYRPFAKGVGSTMGDEGRDRDYALYQGTALRLPGEDTRKLKAALAEMADSRHKPHLLELTALLSSSEGKVKEAMDLLEHAESLYVIAADKLRVILYLAELHRRENHMPKVKELLQKTIDDKAFKDEPALQAAKAMLKDVQ